MKAQAELDALQRVRIVLVETSHPGNIGAVARAMKNMNLSHLYLVSPQYFPHPEAEARASGADDLLRQAVVCASLDEAVTGCSLVVGASARLRTLQWPQLDARQAGQKIVHSAQAGEVAVVLGRERNGLSNEELERCHFLVHIPGNPEYNSLNIAAAVQVLAYEIFMAHNDTPAWPLPEDPEDLPALHEDLERFYAHLEQVLIAVEFMDPQQPKKLMPRLRRLFNRAQPDRRELNILRGILTAVEKAIRSIT